MSEHTVEQVKALITSNLSTVEKAQLIEWLGANLRQALLADEPSQPHVPTTPAYDEAHLHDANGFIPTQALTPPNELPWKDQPWTEEELRELMRPNPKTGAEIVQLLERLDLSEWEAMDIPDVVEWVNMQRRQATQRRMQQWAELP